MGEMKGKCAFEFARIAQIGEMKVKNAFEFARIAQMGEIKGKGCPEIELQRKPEVLSKLWRSGAFPVTGCEPGQLQATGVQTADPVEPGQNAELPGKHRQAGCSCLMSSSGSRHSQVYEI
ncbi:hypothetical protein BK144_17455 [Paenibacillus sp. FSL R7-0273]|nr:hypothetical protein BK144_17455 [Paenibacillus sp. FSL R7-0273]